MWRAWCLCFTSKILDKFCVSLLLLRTDKDWFLKIAENLSSVNGMLHQDSD